MRPAQTYPFPKPEGRPACIAHRGAQAHAVQNTLRAFRTAAELGADMWELDLRLTADGVPVVIHDATTGPVFGVDLEIAATPFAALRKLVPDAPTLDEVIALARELDQALYIEIKAPGAGRVAMEHLGDFAPAGLGSFLPDEVAALIAADCPWPVAVLVPNAADPLALAAETRADIVHLCWERASDRPQDLVTPKLLAALEAQGLGLVLWHEERPAVLRDLERLPALGICTDKPELMRGFAAEGQTGIEVVCHRGLNHIAPENTVAAALLAYDFGCDWLELDVRESADGELVVLHDPTLDRTTDGTGPVTEKMLAELKALDAGSWFSRFYQGQRLQTLREAILLCQAHGKRMYIEVKACDIVKLWDLVTELGFEEDCFFWSFDEPLMRALYAYAPKAQFKANIPHYGSFGAMWDALDPEICEIQLEDWDREAPLCRQHGIRPMLQYFGDEPEDFDRIAELKPEMINLDRADMLLAALRRAKGQA